MDNARSQIHVERERENGRAGSDDCDEHRRPRIGRGVEATAVAGRFCAAIAATNPDLDHPITLSPQRLLLLCPYPLPHQRPSPPRSRAAPRTASPAELPAPAVWAAGARGARPCCLAGWLVVGHKRAGQRGGGGRRGRLRDQGCDEAREAELPHFKAAETAWQQQSP